MRGISSKDGYTSDSRDGASKYNLWVNSKGVYYAGDCREFNTIDFSNFLLGNMINGDGPENIVFPTNGRVSTYLKNSGIANDAIEAFYKKNASYNGEYLIGFTSEMSGNTHSLGSVLENGLWHPETFLGSATVTVSKTNAEEIMVEIFNVTSITSGDLWKHMPWNHYTKSVVRNNDGKTEKNKYGNISQTFSFTVPIDRNRVGKKK